MIFNSCCCCCFLLKISLQIEFIIQYVLLNKSPNYSLFPFPQYCPYWFPINRSIMIIINLITRPGPGSGGGGGNNAHKNSKFKSKNHNLKANFLFCFVHIPLIEFRREKIKKKCKFENKKKTSSSSMSDSWNFVGAQKKFVSNHQNFNVKNSDHFLWSSNKCTCIIVTYTP